MAQARSLTQELVDSIAVRIASGHYEVGEKLPTEAEIMAQEGVSRTVVREALSRLNARGLIETRHGIGSFVRGFGDRPAYRLDPDDARTLEDVIRLLEFRISVEVEAAGLAAQRRSESQLLRLNELLQALKAAEAEPETSSIDSDLAFHLEIAECSANHYFTDTLAHLGKALIPRSRFSSAGIPGGDRRSYLERINQEHENIYQAIERGDAASAMAAMRLHLTNSKERLHRFFESSAR